MKRERNEELEVEKKAKRKTKKVALFLYAFCIIAMGISMIMQPLSKIIVIIIALVFMLVMVTLLSKYFLYPIAIQDEHLKVSKRYANEYLMKEDYLEVIPINSKEYKGLIIDYLPRIAKFYAKFIADDVIKIFIQFNGEEEKLTLRNINPLYFKEYYVFKKEIEEKVRKKFNFEKDKYVEVIAAPSEDEPIAKEWLEKTKKAKVRYLAKEIEQREIIVIVANDKKEQIGGEVVYKNYYTFYNNFEPKNE